MCGWTMPAARSMKAMRPSRRSPRVSVFAAQPRSRSNTANALAWRRAVRNAPLLTDAEDRKGCLNWRANGFRTLACVYELRLHAPPILPAHLEQRLGNLTERAHAHGLHQLREDVAVLDDDALEALERRRRGLRIARMKLRQPL